MHGAAFPWVSPGWPMPIGQPGGAIGAEATAVAAAFSTPPTAARLGLIDASIKALKSAGAWTQLDLLYVLAAADSQAALINWKNPGTFTLSAVNSPTFTVDVGYNSDGATSYLDTVWDAATNAVQLAQNSAHIGAYRNVDGASAISEFGTGTTSTLRVRARSGTGGITSVTSLGVITGTAAVVTLPCHAMGIRRASNTVLYWRDGAQDNSAADNSIALTTVDLNILRTNSNFLGVNAKVSAAHCGGALDDTQAAGLYTALHNYMVAVGADT